MPRAFAATLTLLTVLPTCAQDAEWGKHDFLKIVPADSIAIVIPSQDGFGERGDKVARAIDVNNLFLPSSAMMLLRSSLGVSVGVDTSGPIVGLLLSPKTETSWAFGIPISDEKALLKTFGRSPEELAGGAIVESEHDQPRGFPRAAFIAVRDRHLWMAPDKELLAGLLEQESLHDQMTPQQRDEFAASDIMLHVGMGILHEDDREGFGDWLTEVFGEDEQMAAKAGVLAQHLKSCQGSLAFDEGMRMHFRATLDGDPEAERILRALTGEGESILHGLPEGNLVVASAVHGMTEGAANMFADFTRAGLFSLWGPGPQARTSAISGILSDLSLHLDNTAAALYLNERPDEHGAFSMAIVLTPSTTPDEFMTELRSLSQFVNARAARDLRLGNAPVDDDEVARLVEQLGSELPRERAAAIAKLRIVGEPALAALDKAAGEDHPVRSRQAAKLAKQLRRTIARQTKQLLERDLLNNLKPRFVFRKNSADASRPIVEILLEPGQARTNLNKQLTPLFGEGWKRMRFAVLEKHVVVLFGTNDGLLDRTVAAVRAEDVRIAQMDPVHKFRTRPDTQRLAEWHLSIPRLLSAVYNKPGPTEPPTEFTSLSFARRTGELRADLYLPVSELRQWKTIEDAAR